jgi:hypothetical protein
MHPQAYINSLAAELDMELPLEFWYVKVVKVFFCLMLIQT